MTACAVLLTVLLAAPAAAQGDPEALGKSPWPGMTAWDVAWCRDLVAAAHLIEVRHTDGSRTVVVVHDVRGWRRPNGYYGLKINGQPVDEGDVWILYAGRMTNLRVLFTYGSAPVDEAFSKNHSFREGLTPVPPMSPRRSLL